MLEGQYVNMINVEFSQTICKGSLRVVDDAASVELYARAGIAEEDSNSLKAQDCSFDLGVTKVG